MSFCQFCCAVVKTEGVKFIRVPKEDRKRQLWEESLGCSLAHNARICDTHFKGSDFYGETKSKEERKRRRLMPNALPRQPTPEPESTPTVKPGYSNAYTQTDIDLENFKLKQKNSELEKHIHHLRQQLAESDSLRQGLTKIFTQNQIKMLSNCGKRIKFNSSDMSEAICLHSLGPRAYNHLSKKGYPLPSRATLYRWLSEVDIKTGTLDICSHGLII